MASSIYQEMRDSAVEAVEALQPLRQLQLPRQLLSLPAMKIQFARHGKIVTAQIAKDCRMDASRDISAARETAFMSGERLLPRPLRLQLLHQRPVLAIAMAYAMLAKTASTALRSATTSEMGVALLRFA